MHEIVIAPVPVEDADADGYVELARTRTGRLFRKHILNKGILIHPTTKQKIPIDDDFIQHLQTNFENKVCDIVQVPKAGPHNEHTESPDANIGEVIGIEHKGDKVYAIFDCRVPEDADKLGHTLLGASALMHLNYEDTRSGKKVGPTLLHMAVTNRPYVVDLEDYEELAALSADGTDDIAVVTPEIELAGSAVVDDVDEDESDELDRLFEERLAELDDYDDDEDDETSEPEAVEDGLDELDTEVLNEVAVPPEQEKEDIMDLDELLSALKEEHGIDVLDLQVRADQGHSNSEEFSAALSGVLAASGVLRLSNGEEASVDDMVGAIGQLAQEKVSLSNRIDQLERDKAEMYIDDLVDNGRILPKQREPMLDLYLTNFSLFSQLLPEKSLLPLSQEVGLTPPDAMPEYDLDAEITRLTNIGHSLGYVR